MCNVPTSPRQQSQENPSKTPGPSWTTFPGHRLEDGARLRCGGCDGPTGGILHVSAPDRRPHPVVLCSPCLKIIAAAVRSKDLDQLDAAAQRLTCALLRSEAL